MYLVNPYNKAAFVLIANDGQEIKIEDLDKKIQSFEECLKQLNDQGISIDEQQAQESYQNIPTWREYFKNSHNLPNGIFMEKLPSVHTKYWFFDNEKEVFAEMNKSQKAEVDQAEAEQAEAEKRYKILSQVQADQRFYSNLIDMFRRENQTLSQAPIDVLQSFRKTATEIQTLINEGEFRLARNEFQNMKTNDFFDDKRKARYADMINNYENAKDNQTP